MRRFDPAAVNHWDLPVTGFKPRAVTVRVLEPAVTADPAVEAVLRREQVQVFDFYRHRPDRAAELRRYA